MSAFEPQLPTEPKVDMPDFMVVLRGFDRRQVEVWAAEVASQIEQERLRADEAERNLYRMQIENKGAPSFTHLGTHVASILEEAGRSSENMLADAAERAQEAIEAAEEEAAEIIKTAEHRAGEIEQEAHRTLEDARAEGTRVEEDALQAAEEMRVQAEQDARTVLEEARDATDMIWQEAERERIAVEAETIRLETLRHRSLEQLGRVYGHLESVLDEVRAGIGRVEEEEDEAEAAAAAAARLGVEPPASSPETSPRFPSTSNAERSGTDDAGDEGGVLAATRPDSPATTAPAAIAAGSARPAELSAQADTAALKPPAGQPAEATRPGTSQSGGSDRSDGSDGSDGSGGIGRPEQPALTDADDQAASTGADPEATQHGPAAGTSRTTQEVPAAGTSRTTQEVPAAGTSRTTQEVPAAGGSDAAGLAPNGEGRTRDDDATQRLEPVSGKGRQTKPATRDAKDRP